MPRTAGNRARGDRFRRWLSATCGDSSAGVACRASHHWLRAACFAALSCTCPGWAPAVAGEYDLGAGFLLAHDSNITRTADPRADWTEIWFAGVGYAERTADLTARLNAQVERRDFIRNTYQNDTAYFLNGAAVWTIAPQQLSWTVEDLAGESILNLTAPDTPANRTRTNSLSTGPEFTFRVDPTNTPVIGARYGRYDIRGPGTDNQRYTGYARWLHQLSEPEKLSLNYEAMRVNFSSPALYPNFLQHDQFLRYERLSRPNSLLVEGGTTRVQRYGGEETHGRLARVAALHALTSESAVRLLLADQISDSATDSIRGVTSVTSPTTIATPTETAASAPITGSNVTTGDVYRSQRGEVTYITQSGRTGYTLQGYVRRVDYATLDQDYREAGGNLTLNSIQTEAVRIYASAEYMKRTFSSLGERDRYRTGILGTTFRLTRSLGASVEFRLMERESNVPLESFLDRRVMLLLGYSTGPQYSAGSRR